MWVLSPISVCMFCNIFNFRFLYLKKIQIEVCKIKRKSALNSRVLRLNDWVHNWSYLIEYVDNKTDCPWPTSSSKSIVRIYEAGRKTRESRLRRYWARTMKGRLHEKRRKNRRSETKWPSNISKNTKDDTRRAAQTGREWKRKLVERKSSLTLNPAMVRGRPWFVGWLVTVSERKISCLFIYTMVFLNPYLCLSHQKLQSGFTYITNLIQSVKEPTLGTKYLLNKFFHQPLQQQVSL